MLKKEIILIDRSLFLFRTKEFHECSVIFLITSILIDYRQERYKVSQRSNNRILNLISNITSSLQCGKRDHARFKRTEVFLSWD